MATSAGLLATDTGFIGPTALRYASQTTISIPLLWYATNVTIPDVATLDTCFRGQRQKTLLT